MGTILRWGRNMPLQTLRAAFMRVSSSFSGYQWIRPGGLLSRRLLGLTKKPSRAVDNSKGGLLYPSNSSPTGPSLAPTSAHHRGEYPLLSPQSSRNALVCTFASAAATKPNAVSLAAGRIAATTAPPQKFITLFNTSSWVRNLFAANKSAPTLPTARPKVCARLGLHWLDPPIIRLPRRS